MSVWNDVWTSVRTIATVRDKTEANTRDIRALNTSLTETRERLAAVEAIITFASRGVPRLPQGG